MILWDKERRQQPCECGSSRQKIPLALAATCTLCPVCVGGTSLLVRGLLTSSARGDGYQGSQPWELCWELSLSTLPPAVA